MKNGNIFYVIVACWMGQDGTGQDHDVDLPRSNESTQDSAVKKQKGFEI